MQKVLMHLNKYKTILMKDTLVDIKLELNKELNKEYNWDKDSVLNPLDEFFKALPIAAVALLSQIPQLGNLLDIFLPDRQG